MLRRLDDGYELDDDPARVDLEVTFAFLLDVFVLPDHRGRGLGVELVREAVELGPHADLQWHLGTRDTHRLYEGFGFGRPNVERQMLRPGVKRR